MRETEEALDLDRLDTTFKLNVKGTTAFATLGLIGSIISEAGPDTGQSVLHVQSKYIYFAIHKILNSG